MRTKLGVVSVIPPGVLWSLLAQPASSPVIGQWALQPGMAPPRDGTTICYPGGKEAYQVFFKSAHKRYMNNNELRNIQVKLCEWLHFFYYYFFLTGDTDTRTLQSSLYEAYWQDAHVPPSALIILHLSPNRFTLAKSPRGWSRLLGNKNVLVWQNPSILTTQSRQHRIQCSGNLFSPQCNM